MRAAERGERAERRREAGRAAGRVELGRAGVSARAGPRWGPGSRSCGLEQARSGLARGWAGMAGLLRGKLGRRVTRLWVFKLGFLSYFSLLFYF